MSFRSRGLNKLPGSGWSLGGSPSEYRMNRFFPRRSDDEQSSRRRTPYGSTNTPASSRTPNYSTGTPSTQPTSAPSSTPSYFRGGGLSSSTRTSGYYSGPTGQASGYFSGPTGQSTGLFGSLGSRFSGLAGRYM